MVIDGEDDDLSIKVEFDKGKLRMSRLMVDDDTKTELRNIMAFEQWHYINQSYVCHYISLLDSLIDSERDVEILVENKILVNLIGHDGLLADMINRLTYGIVEGKSCFCDVVKQLEEHHDKWWNRNMATLRRSYCPHIWGATATAAAIILLVLTFIQTVSLVVGIFRG